MRTESSSRRQAADDYRLAACAPQKFRRGRPRGSTSPRLVILSEARVIKDLAHSLLVTQVVLCDDTAFGRSLSLRRSGRQKTLEGRALGKLETITN